MKILVVLLIAALSSSSAHGKPSAPEASPQAQEATAPPPKNEPKPHLGSKSSPLYVVPVQSQSGVVRQSSSDRLQVKDVNSNQLIMAFTGGMLLIAAVQAGLFLWQLRLMRVSLSSAETAARSAESTVEIMRDTAQRQLRAYITVETAKIEFPEPGRPRSTVNYRNAGQTPAHDVQIWIHQWIACYPMGCELPHPPEDFVMAKALLGSGSFNTMVTEAPQPLAKDQFLDLIGTAEGTIYVYGEIRYKDVFGHGHYCKYKFMYGGSEPTRAGTLKPCPDGNEAD